MNSKESCLRKLQLADKYERLANERPRDRERLMDEVSTLRREAMTTIPTEGTA